MSDRRDPLLRSMRLLGLRPMPVAKSLLLGAGASTSALALAALSAWLILRAWQMPPVLALSVAVTAVRALGISRALLRYLERLATHDLALGAMATARVRIYRALAGGTASYSVSVRRSDVVGRAGEDIDEIGFALIRGLIPIGSAVVTSVAAVAVMTLISPWAGLVVAVGWVVAAVVGPWCAVRGTARSEIDERAARADQADTVATLLWHAPELVVAGRRDEMVASAHTAGQRASRAADRGMRTASWAAGAVPAVTGLTVLLACLLATGTAGDVDATTVGVLILLPLSAFEAAGGLLDAARQLHRSHAAATRVMAMIDAAGGSLDPARESVSAAPPDRIPAPGTPAVEVDAALRWGHAACSAVGPAVGVGRVPAGARIAVVGPSGSGKSALLLTLAGLLPPIAGTVATSDGRALADTVRFFGDDAHIFATSVRENLLASRGDADDAAITAAIDAVGLSDWVRRLPDGLDTVLHSGGDAVSAGQRRRLLLARAIVNPFPVLLLDEPCEHLDRDESDRLHRALLDRAGGLLGPDRTVVVATHRLPTDCVPDRVVDLDHELVANRPGCSRPAESESGKSVAEDRIPA